MVTSPPPSTPPDPPLSPPDEDPYRTFVRLSSEGIFRFDLRTPVATGAPVADQVAAFLHDALCVDANDALARMYGLPAAEDLVGTPLSTLMPPEDPRTQEFLEAFVAGGYRLDEVPSHELAADGSPRVFSNTVLGVVREGHLLRVWGTQRDVTDQRAAQDALRASEARHRAILNAAFDAIVLADTDGRILEFNPSAERLFDGQRQDMLGRRLPDVLRPAAADAAAGGLPPLGRRIEVEGLRIGGEPFPAEASAHALRLPQGGDALAVFIRDLTAWKAYERELVAAREQAEKAACLKASLLANMSHEIRTPLTAILGFADLLCEDPEDARDLAPLIRRGGQRLLTTLNSVLDLARIESGADELERACVDVSALAQEAAALCERQAAERGLTLSAQVVPGAYARADAGALARVLDNLLANAVKFTEEGGVTLRVATIGQHVVLRVEDTGVGIPEAFRPHLFEAFQQASTGFARTHEGTGLGLALAHRLVTAMDGELTVHSEVGVGSVFTVRLAADVAGCDGPPSP